MLPALCFRRVAGNHGSNVVRARAKGVRPPLTR